MSASPGCRLLWEYYKICDNLLAWWILGDLLISHDTCPVHGNTFFLDSTSSFPLSQAIPVLLKSCRVAKYYLSFVLLTIRPDAKSCHGGALGINLGNQTHLSSADPLEDPADHLA